MFYALPYASPVGELTVVSDGEQIVGLWIEGQKYFRATLREPPAEGVDLPVLRAARRWLDGYFAGERPDASALPLAPAGSGFRQRVWSMLREIPCGEVTTYGALAKRLAAELGRPTMSAQAVGGAVGHNPISIILPCHRVVGSNGSLTGYAGGVERKVALLTLEGADMSRLFVPGKGTAL